MKLTLTLDDGSVKNFVEEVVAAPEVTPAAAE